MDLVVKSYSQICQIRNQLILIDNLDPKLAVVYGIFFASILPSHENLDIDQWLLKSVAFSKEMIKNMQPSFTQSFA